MPTGPGPGRRGAAPTAARGRLIRRPITRRRACGARLTGVVRARVCSWWCSQLCVFLSFGCVFADGVSCYHTGGGSAVSGSSLAVERCLQGQGRAVDAEEACSHCCDAAVVLQQCATGRDSRKGQETARQGRRSSGRLELRDCCWFAAVDDAAEGAGCWQLAWVRLQRLVAAGLVGAGSCWLLCVWGAVGSCWLRLRVCVCAEQAQSQKAGTAVAGRLHSSNERSNGRSGLEAGNCGKAGLLLAARDSGRVGIQPWNCTGTGLMLCLWSWSVTLHLINTGHWSVGCQRLL